jgi:hypothetical protein
MDGEEEEREEEVWQCRWEMQAGCVEWSGVENLFLPCRHGHASKQERGQTE